MKRPIIPKLRDTKATPAKSGVSASHVMVSSGARKIGYARVSTFEQNLDLQIAALTAVGCTDIRQEKASAVKGDPPIFAQTVAELRAGDSLVVWKIDRAGRSARALLELVEELKSRGVSLSITTLGADTATPAGKMFLTMLAAFAEFETSQMKERTTAGRIEARKRGVQFGPRPKMTPPKLKAARQLLNDPSASVSTVARALGVGRATLYRSLQGNAE